ncbi:MAG: hypothetical protein GF355_05830 [Candidatus Eisenbacteria bacterium]|nr:hypothetical protein [Candidatus Eisenbacteria bacterium]
MRPLGHALMWIGFIAAAFVTTRQLDAVAWGWYGAAGVVAVAGVVILRRTATAAASDAAAVRANIGVLEQSARRLVDRIASINGERETIFVYDVHGRIDDELSPDLADFAEARESMIHAVGLQAYAEVMDNFGRAERLINRAWSASADGYIDEVWSCMEAAQEAMGEADRLLNSHLGAVSGS